MSRLLAGHVIGSLVTAITVSILLGSLLAWQSGRHRPDTGSAAGQVPEPAGMADRRPDRRPDRREDSPPGRQ